MADLKISNLPNNATPLDADIFPHTKTSSLVTSGVTWANIKATLKTYFDALYAITVETPTGSVNGSNQAFTVSAEPKWVVSDGITYFDGAGYSYAALTVTMTIPPSSYIRAII